MARTLHERFRAIPAEVGRLRTRALATQSLIAERTEVVGKMVASCRVPKSMNYFYDGQEQAAR